MRLVITLAFLAVASAAELKSIELPSPALPAVQKTEEAPTPITLSTNDVPTKVDVVDSTPLEEASLVPVVLGQTVAEEPKTVNPVTVVESAPIEDTVRVAIPIIPVIPLEETVAAAQPTVAIDPVQIVENPIDAVPKMDVEPAAPTPVQVVEVAVNTPETTETKKTEMSPEPTAEISPEPVKLEPITISEIQISPVPTAETVIDPVKVVDVAINTPDVQMSDAVEAVHVVNTPLGDIKIHPRGPSVMTEIATPELSPEPTPVQVVDVAINSPEPQKTEFSPEPTAEATPVQVVEVAVNSPETQKTEISPEPTAEATPVQVVDVAFNSPEIQKTEISPESTAEIVPEPVKIVDVAVNTPEAERTDSDASVEPEPVNVVDAPINYQEVQSKGSYVEEGGKVIVVDLPVAVETPRLPSNFFNVDISPLIIPPEVMRQAAQMAHEPEAVFIGEGEASPFAYNQNNEPLEVEPVRVVDSPANELDAQMDPVVIVETDINAAPYPFPGAEFQAIPQVFMRPHFNEHPYLPPHLAPFFQDQRPQFVVPPQYLRGAAFHNFEFEGVQQEDLREPNPYDLPAHLMGQVDPFLR